ncbi:macro domain-containing protein [Brevifollis gellanilyticus]|uniref:Appr-1-p processing protein n=1 Tax=Brevifollis gellanilyticus TaxID=748831 RepID=A0A512MAT8_9BACT|nr:macro domain-containing protein [Brevifollis gellanilyticus]GEP43843.1 Appr-1-p processing protein [Brevifollis gellanilyticus]
MKPIIYTEGDATRPQASGPLIIAHVCNDIGAWGAGFVLAISRCWKSPEKHYRQWARGQIESAPPFALGEVQFVPVDETITVANMVAQHDIRSDCGLPPIRYDALDKALEKLGTHALHLGTSVHMPRIGCGLAGGTWSKVEPMLLSHLSQRDVQVTVYDFSPV